MDKKLPQIPTMTEKTMNHLCLIVADMFKKRRNDLGMTQQALSEVTRLSIITIKRMEQGNHNPGLKQFILVANALGLLEFMTLFPIIKKSRS